MAAAENSRQGVAAEGARMVADALDARRCSTWPRRCSTERPDAAAARAGRAGAAGAAAPGRPGRPPPAPPRGR